MSDIAGAKPNIGIILLAAGASVRMGTPKQLLKLGGVSLIRRAAENALTSGCRPVVVVLGAKAGLIVPELNGLAIEIVENAEWKTGLSASIRCGLQRMRSVAPEVEGVILFLADQPQVSGTALQKLTAAHALSTSGLVAASYAGHMGTPALFPREYFDELSQIEGPGGAKGLLAKYAKRVASVDFPEAAIDLDTPLDFTEFAKNNTSAGP